MKNAGAVFLMGFVSVLSAAVAVAGMAFKINISNSLSNDKNVPTSKIESIEFLPFDNDVLPIVSESVASKDLPKEENSSVTVLSPEYAKGKIYDKFLSPYSAGLKYDNIYISNSTGLDINIEKELKTGSKIKLKQSSVPQVLIVHTHATESFMSGERDYYTEADIFNTTDPTKSVIRLGNIMSDILTKNGIGVIHNTTLHDNPAYTGSYGRAEQTIKEILKKYPTIKVVIDIHRDSIAQNSTDRIRPVTDINGKKAAQVMLVMGSNTGSVSGFENWRENFRLALSYQQALESMYPGLARKMTLASKKYNQHLTTGSMLLEIGTDANTLEQAEYSSELAANALLKVLNTLK